MSVVAIAVVGAGSVLAVMGLRCIGRLSVLWGEADAGVPDGAQTSVEHFKLGRAHAIVGQKPRLASAAYLDGYGVGRRLAERPTARV